MWRVACENLVLARPPCSRIPESSFRKLVLHELSRSAQRGTVKPKVADVHFIGKKGRRRSTRLNRRQRIFEPFENLIVN